VLLAGDETAAPAICAILEGLPAGYAGHAVIEVPTVDDALPVATASAVEQVWLPREGVAHGESLCTAVRRLLPARPRARPVRIPEVDVDRELLWDVADAAAPGHDPGDPGDPRDPRDPGDPGDPGSDPRRTAPAYAWVAGEAATVRDIRRHLVGAVQLPRRSVSFMGYWRQGRAEG
jgi:NADPH-dependent ferric siderophore reductase